MAAKGWTMTAVAIAVAAGTYFTLETLYPPSKNGDVDLRLVPPEAVFGSSLQTDVAQTAMADDAPAVAEREPAATPDTADGMTDPLPDTVDGTAAGEYGLAGEAPTDDTAEDAEGFYKPTLLYETISTLFSCFCDPTRISQRFCGYLAR